MFGNRKNLPKREPKEMRVSERKMVEGTENVHNRDMRDSREYYNEHFNEENNDKE